MNGALSSNETILNHLLALKLDVWLSRSQIGHGQMDSTFVFIFIFNRRPTKEGIVGWNYGEVLPLTFNCFRATPGTSASIYIDDELTKSMHNTASAPMGRGIWPSRNRMKGTISAIFEARM